MKGSARRFPVAERVRTSLWFVPSLCVLAAIALAWGAVAIDRRIPQDRTAWFLFGGGPESARNLLSTIAAAMVTSISLIFSVTMVVLQLASAQYSPRVLRTFIRDRLVQVVLGVYIATFVYSLLVLPEVRSGASRDSVHVPALAVSLSLVLALVSLALVVRYIDHVAHAIRATNLLSAVAEETRQAIKTLYPEQLGDERSVEEEGGKLERQPDQVVNSDQPPGVVVAVDEERLLEWAEKADVLVEVVPLVGEFVPEGAPLFVVFGASTDFDTASLVRCIGLARERTMHQDPAFGFRQIVDIAERALSPGVNDPTTAVQAVDHLHDLLRRLGTRDFPSPVRVDGAGKPRVIAPRYGWDDYVELAFDEIRHYGGGSVQVALRLRGAIDDLLGVVPETRRAPLELELDLLDKSTEREFPDVHDRTSARRAALIS